MSTGTELIKDALKESRVLSIAVPSSPEQISDGMNKLNSMLQMWVTRNIFLGTIPITAPGQSVDEPVDCRNGIVYNLAILLANLYGEPVSVELRTNASREFGNIKRNYEDLTIPSKIPSTTLPRGAGNSKGVDPRIFHRDGDPLGA